MLDAVLRRGETVERATARAPSKLPEPDRRLAIAIVGETLRRLPSLDAMIDSRTRQRLPDDSKSRMVLRLALAQRLALDIPDHAVVATALPLVDGGPRRLVHGVLGALLRGKLDTTTTLPVEVEARWSAAWGHDVVAAARRMILERPPLDLSFREAGTASSFPLGETLAERHRRLPSDAVPALPGFEQGTWWVQDLASSIPARLVPSEATNVLDMCAAPGGKTMQLAAAGHQVTALDRSESRLARLRENLERTGLQAEVIAADALGWSSPVPFDTVLLDAPCSATGTFRRHPEVLYRARRSAIDEAVDLQRRLLDRAAGLVRPGGGLVYAVCSLEPEEGERQITAFLERQTDFRLRFRDPAIAGIAAASEGWVRIVPGMLEAHGGLDGFFAAHLVRDR